MEQIKTIKIWNTFHAIALILAGIGALLFQSVLPLLVFAFASFVIYIFYHLPILSAFRPFGGYANWVTFFRLILVFVLAYFFNRWSSNIIFLIALCITCFDGLDGYLARRHQQTSDFGGYLDMETDTFYVCILCFSYYLYGYLGWWILIIGGMRYLYVGLLHLFRLQNKKEKSTRFAKTIAVVLFVALLFPLVFPIGIYLPVVLMASFLILYSFFVSFRSLWED